MSTVKRKRFTNKGTGAGFGPAYSFMRFTGACCNWLFFRKVEASGGEEIPKTGPIMVVATHFATLMDTSILSEHMPYGRKLHYWAKRGLYKHPVASFILNDSGNIQVDRKTKNNQALFSGTFEALREGECIALFPEGGSFTEPHLHAMKAGAAWAALEYAKNLQMTKDRDPQHTNITIVPAGINYTDKSRYRSSASLEWGPCFSVDEFTAEFLQAESSNEEAAKNAVRKLTARIGDELRKLSINAPDWITWHAMKVGRDLIWQEDGELPVPRLRITSNDLITILAPPAPPAEGSEEANNNLSSFMSSTAVSSSSMTNDVPDMSFADSEVAESSRFLEEAQHARDLLSKLSAVCVGCSTTLFTLNRLADDLTKRGHPADGSLPPFWLSSKIFVSHFTGLLLRAPYLLPLFALHLPPYAISIYCSTKYASHEEESMASAKSLVAYGFGGIWYGLIIWLFWVAFLFTPPGLIFGFLFCYSLMHIHHAVVDDTYDRVKLTLASARLMMASLGGESWQLDLEDPAVKHAIDTVRAGAPIQDTINLKKKRGPKGKKERPWRPRLMGVALRLRQEARAALRESFDAVQRQGTVEQKEALLRIIKIAGPERVQLQDAGRLTQAQRLRQRLARLSGWKAKENRRNARIAAAGSPNLSAASPVAAGKRPAAQNGHARAAANGHQQRGYDDDDE